MIAPDPPAGWQRTIGSSGRNVHVPQGDADIINYYQDSYSGPYLNIRLTRTGFDVVRRQPRWDLLADAEPLAGPFDTLEAALAAHRLLTSINTEEKP